MHRRAVRRIASSDSLAADKSWRIAASRGRDTLLGRRSRHEFFDNSTHTMRRADRSGKSAKRTQHPAAGICETNPRPSRAWCHDQISRVSQMSRARLVPALRVGTNLSRPWKNRGRVALACRRPMPDNAWVDPHAGVRVSRGGPGRWGLANLVRPGTEQP